MQVMIVDDSRTFLASLEGVLTRLGHAVEKAASGEEAITRLKGGLKPRVVITDFNMGEMDGIAFIKQAKTLPGMAFTPMILLTTESQQAKRDQARAAGAAGWLVKPVAPDALAQVLNQLVPA
ncbi:response regulator [Marinibaculum pumilum]|uniref:Response regulator n=1 Tax=Marinibaculum pumilum TaxID=1766165 RepID=A0ABV7KTU6_9PROT